jgi:hypothetical protein
MVSREILQKTPRRSAFERAGLLAIILLMSASGLGCGGATAAGAVATDVAPALPDEPIAEPVPPRPEGARAIEPPASYSSIVSAARVLDERSEADSEEDCMLRRPSREGWPWILALDIAAAVRPLPEAPADLDARLDGSPSPVLVITRWGQLGSRSFELALAMISNTPPRVDEAAVVLALSNRGVYLRRTDRLVSAGRTAPIPIGELSTRLEGELEAGQLVIVTAEAEITAEQLWGLLRALPASARVGLAVALGEEIQVPDPPPLPTDRGAGVCLEGLPALPSDAERGQLETPLIVGAMRPFQVAARQCLTEATMASAPGGRVEVAMRIGPEGVVGEACLSQDEIGDTLLRDCLLRAARSLRFPRPDPAGFIDLSLPLLLQPAIQSALCEE